MNPGESSPARAGVLPPGESTASTSLAMLVLHWQETGSHAALEALIRASLPELRRVIERTLRGRGTRDPAAVDDALALVLDHLRRLAAGGDDERGVMKFSATRPSPESRAVRDPGIVYIRQIARARAIDVARGRRRQRSVALSQLDEGVACRPQQAPAGGPADPTLGERLHAVVGRLEPRERALVELLLEGKNQAVIAHVLGISEGTVSRLRGRAIESLRRLLR